MPKIKIIAHRGVSSEAPENTLASIKKAIQMDVDCLDIEIDVRLSNDYIPIVIHDPSLERTTAKKHSKKISEMSLEEIKKLEVGSWHNPVFEGEKVPTLKEVLELDFRKKGLMIEIKPSPFQADLVADKVLNIIQEVKPSFPLIFGSFDPLILDAIHQRDPLLDLIYIVEELDLLDAYHCRHIAIHHEILSPELAKDLLKKRVQIWSFTVDSPKKAQDLVDLGVTGIITNNPSYMQRFFG